MADSLLARKYFDGIYIPSGLLVVGTLIVKKEWTPYAVLIAILLGSIKFYNNRMAQSRSMAIPVGHPN
jgi:cytochrome-b5 reductase